MADNKTKKVKEHYLDKALELIPTCDGCEVLIDFVVVDLNAKGAAQKIEALYNLSYRGYKAYCTDEQSFYVFKLTD